MIGGWNLLSNSILNKFAPRHSIFLQELNKKKEEYQKELIEIKIKKEEKKRKRLEKRLSRKLFLQDSKKNSAPKDFFGYISAEKSGSKKRFYNSKYAEENQESNITINRLLLCQKYF